MDKLKIDVNEITARVSGTVDYKVEIELSNNRVLAMSCNCPYAEDDNNCKHMAAVMYEAFEVENVEDEYEDRDYVDVDIDDENVYYDNKNADPSEADILTNMLAFAAKKAAAYENMLESWTRDYHVGILATTYLELLISNTRPESEILAYADKYWNYPEVRKTCVQYYLNQNDHTKAIEILKTSIALDDNFSGLVKKYRLQLKDLYLLHGDHDAYLEQLWNLMLIDLSNDIDLFKELKSNYSSQEWLDKRELIFNAFQNSIALDTFYLEENLYDRLLEAVQNSKGIDRLQKYEKVLSPLFPKEVLNKYDYEISQMAQPLCDDG